MHARIVIAFALLLAAAAPAAAQLYKWVDERGVTNYSNQPPPEPKAAKNLRQVEDRVSVYSPDPALLEAMEDARRNGARRSADRQRIENLESQLEAERRARQQAAAAADARAAAYEKCLAEGRPDCHAIYGGYPYDPPVVIVGQRHRHRPPHISGPPLKPGTTAGHVTADNGIIPGQSGAAPTRTSDRRPAAPLVERTRPVADRR